MILAARKLLNRLLSHKDLQACGRGFSADRVPADRRFSLPRLSLVARRSSPRTAPARPGGLVCAVPVPIGNAFLTNGWSCACGFGARCLLPLWILRFFLRTDQSGRLPKNNSLWASKTGNSGHTKSVTCNGGRGGVFGQPVPRASAPRSRNFPAPDLWLASRDSHLRRAYSPAFR